MKILIVEDNRDLVQVLSEGFNDLNYSVESAFDGIEGLNKIRNSDYDCIILDIMLPEMDGYEVVERAREEGKDTPVIMLTAKDSIEDRVEGLNRGADDYKGVDIVLSSPGGKVSAEYSPKAAKAGAVVIDNTSHFRMEPDVPLVVPEVNPQDVALHTKQGIIANPN
ncbi:MAG TPA: response regulator, partial [Synergistales bacterium]|nr:response regulator [Synergistales bacterium]